MLNKHYLKLRLECALLMPEGQRTDFERVLVHLYEIVCEYSQQRGINSTRRYCYTRRGVVAA